MIDNSEQFETLSRKQVAVIPYLVTSRTIEEAAKKSKTGRSTIHKWLSDCPVFQDELRRQRTALMDATLAGIQGMIETALDTLAEQMQGGSPNVKVRAAVAVLAYACKLRELTDIEARLTRLEHTIR